MSYEKYYEAREKVTDILRKDLLGPVSEHEIIKERPSDYYILGKLYPKESNTDNTVTSSSDDLEQLDIDIQEQISLSNGKNPSSCGISFVISPDCIDISIEVSGAVYKTIDKEDAQSILKFADEGHEKRTQYWSREPFYYCNEKILLADKTDGDLIIEKVTEKLKLMVFIHKTYEDKSKTVTATLVNENISDGDYIKESEMTFFQPQITVRSPHNRAAFLDVRKNAFLNKDPEIAELNMLYSKVNNYASGHGCAVTWELDDLYNAIALKTDFCPEYELLQMQPSASFSHDILSMKFLAEASEKEITRGINSLLELYDSWIIQNKNDMYNLDPVFHFAAERNMERCCKTYERLKRSLSHLENDEIVLRAFKLANLAMFEQRKKMLINTDKFSNDENIRWYPFQLAFFLQEIISMADPRSEERKDVDLLWFPTGGGKTEAYLGVAAFSIFLRRLRHGQTGDGVTVIMRYTLRLLTFQQFERAASLVCACEIIRINQNIPGGEIAIGLWAGRDLTPNYLKDARKILTGEKEAGGGNGNPKQLAKCPWCGTADPDYTCDESKTRLFVRCKNLACEFVHGIPVYLIDEEIYHHLPTFIIATVDKFAQIALNDKTASLFGYGHEKLPPELIIQDELHLISGPLGTITGLYEAAIKRLCEKDGRYPKVIASTATIRNADEQIKALYATGFTQFPPQGISIEDSFFAELSDRKSKPARKYLGCMAVGTSPTTMMVRVMAATLYATRYLISCGYDDEVIDSFWTITGYYNTLRELGGAIVRIADDIQDRFSYLKSSKFAAAFPFKSQDRYDRYKELTSREGSEEIGNIIQKELKIPYKGDGTTDPYDFLLASNMISVGVDVGRLGTMVVVGQPKATTEYIQATSRVGRETPGLVITTYNQAKSRDRSHYEQFRQYHESFYKFVEATSLTPFADRARDRALHTLYVILCRYLIPGLQPNNAASKYRSDLKEAKEIRDYILTYVNIVDPSEKKNVATELRNIEQKWDLKARVTPNLIYNDYNKASQTLFDEDYKEDSRFRVLNSMRSVETSINVYIEE